MAVLGQIKHCLPAEDEIALPCGQCIGCRLEKSRQWAVRITHEAQLHTENAFITLTYDDDHLPADGCLDVEHFQKFMKRLRKAVDRKLLFYHCGEYGEDFQRPHYHACIFGTDFSADRIIYGRDGDHVLYASATLSKAWKKGLAIIGELTFESAAYVARYITKKVTGPAAAEHYTRDNALTGAIMHLTPEYATMSRGGRDGRGIAAEWFDEFEKDVYPWDEVVSRGHAAKPPRYYDKLLEERNPELMEQIKLQRKAAAEERAHDNTPERLKAKEIVKAAQLQQLTRKL